MPVLYRESVGDAGADWGLELGARARDRDVGADEGGRSRVRGAANGEFECEGRP